jgi:hypothetical protein
MRPPAILLLGMSICFGSTVRGSHYDVWFAGGQSNANSLWAQGITTALAESGLWTNPQVVHVGHSGATIWAWHNYYFAQPRQSLYFQDFFDPSPSSDAALEARLKSLTAAGNTVTFRGVFWMQGETNAGGADASTYGSRFLTILDLVRQDLDVPYEIPFVIGLTSGDTSMLPPSAYAYLDVLRQQQQWAADTASYATSVDTAAWPRVDGWHMATADYPKMGYAFGQAYNTMIVPEPQPFLMMLAGVIATRIFRTARRGAARGPA